MALHHQVDEWLLEATHVAPVQVIGAQVHILWLQLVFVLAIVDVCVFENSLSFVDCSEKLFAFAIEDAYVIKALAVGG